MLSICYHIGHFMDTGHAMGYNFIAKSQRSSAVEQRFRKLPSTKTTTSRKNPLACLLWPLDFGSIGRFVISFTFNSVIRICCHSLAVYYFVVYYLKSRAERTPGRRGGRPVVAVSGYAAGAAGIPGHLRGFSAEIPKTNLRGAGIFTEQKRNLPLDALAGRSDKFPTQTGEHPARLFYYISLMLDVSSGRHPLCTNRGVAFYRKLRWGRSYEK